MKDEVLCLQPFKCIKRHYAHLETFFIGMQDFCICGWLCLSVVNLLMHLLEVKVGLKYIHKLKGWKTIPELSDLS